MALPSRYKEIVYARVEDPIHQQTRLDLPIAKVLDFLVHYMEPEFGLLDRLLSNGLLTQMEFQNVRSAWSVTMKNEAIAKYMLRKNRYSELLEVLKKTNQSHLVNYLSAEGRYNPSRESNLPLTDKEETTINVNQEILVELIERTPQLAQILHSNGVLNKRQMDYICGQPGDMKMNEALLEILRKRSIRDYQETIYTLRTSGQQHAADILEGGATARIYCYIYRGENKVDGREVKDIVTLLTEKLNDQLAETLVLKKFGLRTVTFDNGIIYYFYFATPEELVHLREVYDSGTMETIMRRDFDALMLPMDQYSLTATWNKNDFERCGMYFHRVSFTNIDGLPTEILELIFLKVFGIRFCPLNSQSSDEDIILKSLRSMSRKWDHTITRHHFKALAENRVVSRFSQTISQKCDIIGSNQRFLQEYLEPDILIDPLVSAGCLTKERAMFIRYISDRGGRNYELLGDIKSLQFAKQWEFLDCLRTLHQQRVADVIENGGVIVKSRVIITPGRAKEASRTSEKQLVNGLRKMLQQFDKHRLRQLYTDIGMGAIEVFEATWNRGIAIWLLCPSKEDLSHLKKIYLTSDLLNAMNSLFHLIWRLFLEGFDGHQISSRINPRRVVIREIEFKKQVVVRSISARHQKSLSTGGKTLYDVTSLQDKIYVRFSASLSVYEDVPPFACVKNVGFAAVISKPNFTKACEKNMCLYTTSDSGVCKMSAMDYSVKIWLPNIGLKMPCPLSVCCDGKLLILRNDISSPRIELYGDDAQLVKSVTLPTTLHSWTSLSYYCAIESDKGNFILSFKGSEGFSNEYKIALVTHVGSSSLVVTPQPKEAWSQPHFADLPCVTLFKKNLFIVYDSNSGTVVTLNQEFKVKHVLLSRDKGQIHRPIKIHYKETRRQLIIIDSDNGKDVVSLFSLVDDSEGEQTIPVSPEHTTTLDIRKLTPTDVTSLRHDILLLLNGQLIAVYEDTDKFNHKFDVRLREIISPELCSTSFIRIIPGNKNTEHLYVVSNDAVFRLRRAGSFIRSGDPIRITGSSPDSMSVSTDGNILMPKIYTASFEIHNPGNIVSVNLPSYMDVIAQVVEISSGLFVVVYQTREQRNMGNIMKMTADGECVLRPKPDDKSDQPETVWSLASYSSDRVIADDDEGNRVILLDAELNTQYTLLNRRNPLFMCYKKDKRQLIVTHSLLSSEVDVFTLDDDKNFKYTIY